MKTIAINGFGRIGRAALKLALLEPDLKVVAINDIMPIESAAYLLQYDSVYGPYEHQVTTEDSYLVIAGNKIRYLQERDPANLPWVQLEVQVVIESTGLFTDEASAQKHIEAGAATVVLSGPAKDPSTPTIVHGVNTNEGKTIFSCASCTTNNVAPVVEILDRRIGIEKAILNTVHAYTASQSLIDSSNPKNLRMGRAAGLNLVPTSTGAAKATTKALPHLLDKFDGVAIRTPVPVGSISDLTLVSSSTTSICGINDILSEEAKSARYSGVIGVSTQPLVSSDIIKSPLAALVDLSMTRVVGGDLIKVMVWYDNEWGFSNQMMREIRNL